MMMIGRSLTSNSVGTTLDTSFRITTWLCYTVGGGVGVLKEQLFLFICHDS